MSPGFNRFKSDIILILKITIAWMTLGVLFTFYDYLTTSAADYYIRTENYSFPYHLASNLGGSFLGSVFGASLIIFFTNRILRKKSFLTYVLLNSFSVLLVIFLINVIMSLVILSLVHDEGFLSQAMIIKSMSFIFSLQGLRSMLTWFVVTLGTTFILRVSEKYGPGVLEDIILGRYHKPVDEERIFMFLDIKSSTSLAENLGHHKYFKLLSEFYTDITDSIIYNKGEIYQYVGDEVVVSWKLRNGIRNNNCLRCFFEARAVIEKNSLKYMRDFSVVPEFKAGIHIGKTTVGEIGVIKKEIAFSGDVLNTSSRIQGECNKYDAELLISQELLKKLKIDSTFKVENIGEIELRGKKEKILLYSVQMQQEN